MTAAYITVVALALVPQLMFTFLYSMWVPSWVKNPYGRLAQLDSWCRILLLSIALVVAVFGVNDETKQRLFTFAFLPLVLFGILQLVLLKRAVDETAAIKKEADK